MGKLIDAYELMRSMGFHDDCADCNCDDWECIYDRIYTRADMCDLVETHIFDAPAVDAVEVVRCKECKHYLNSCEKCGLIDTRLHFYETDKRWTEDCFCAWGERREDEMR